MLLSVNGSVTLIPQALHVVYRIVIATKTKEGTP